MFIFTILSLLLTLYFFIMWGRFALDMVQAFNRTWRPQRVLLVIAEFVYTVTDPPIKAVRRLLPPLRLGPVALDFGWTIVMLVVIILRVVVQSLAYRFV
ncbi:YggT family protein [Curtobacterium sp. MCBD17_021]|uniref:YggT family protein n=1 Tax=Curtobacterium sp. MCBD17_021 TaxID=2175665 RepID=UPI0021AD4245|nr:YggT family protein [Curtobacterium sp. MCBD17_021]